MKIKKFYSSLKTRDHCRSIKSIGKYTYSCSDGIGKSDLYDLLKNSGSPQRMIESFRDLGFTASSRKAYMFARAMLKTQVILVTDGIDPNKIEDMMLTHAPSIEHALALSFKKLGPNAKVLAIPQADLLIPDPTDQE